MLNKYEKDAGKDNIFQEVFDFLQSKPKLDKHDIDALEQRIRELISKRRTQKVINRETSCKAFNKSGGLALISHSGSVGDRPVYFSKTRPKELFDRERIRKEWTIRDYDITQKKSVNFRSLTPSVSQRVIDKESAAVPHVIARGPLDFGHKF